MKKKRIISFFQGLLFSSLGLLASFLTYSIFSFFFIEVETLQQDEKSRISSLVFAIVLLVITVIICILLSWKKRKYAAFGVIPIPFTILILIVIFILSNLLFPTPFKISEWNKSKDKPFYMAVTLEKENKLIDKSRQEIKRTLGEDYLGENIDATNNSTITYMVQGNWLLFIYLTTIKLLKQN